MKFLVSGKETKRKFVYLFIFLTYFVNSSEAHASSETFNSIDNSSIRLNLKKPEVATFLIFWASWCPTCMAEIPEFKRLHSAYSDIRFIGVNVNKKTSDGLEIQTQRALPYPSIADPDLAFTDMFDIKGTPGFVLIDKDGLVLHKGNRLNKELLNLLKVTNAKETVIETKT